MMQLLLMNVQADWNLDNVSFRYEGPDEDALSGMLHWANPGNHCDNRKHRFREARTKNEPRLAVPSYGRLFNR